MHTISKGRNQETTYHNHTTCTLSYSKTAKLYLNTVGEYKIIDKETAKFRTTSTTFSKIAKYLYENLMLSMLDVKST